MFKPMSDTGLFTVSVAEAVLPLPPSVDVTTDVVLVFVPASVPWTGTLNVQLPPAASVPPLKEIEFPPLTVRLPKLPALQTPG